ncbi:MAG: hypothetical protein HYR63_18245 [Proteobacteria bacterium]|nr:hypothetical protein [Pseudomonadota bacterium]MBI3499523.1 hypothetical protein [Pseudomonadota bacterium]
MAVVFCVLLHIILGIGAGSFVNAVADNAIQFAQDVPAGTLVGIALLALLYWFVKSERRG